MDIRKHLTLDKPPLRPFEVSRDVDLVEDYMTALRRLQFVETGHGEFVTVEYEIRGDRNMLDRTEPELAYLNVIVVAHGNRLCINSVRLEGVADDGVLWFGMFGGFLSSAVELSVRAEVRRDFDETTGGDPQRIAEILQQLQQPPPSEHLPDDGDWWKHLPPPEDGD